MFTGKIRTGIGISLLLAIIVIVGISFYADVPKLLAALAHFQWSYLPLLLGLTLFNYAGRFVKWQYYLKRLHIVLRWQKSLLIFLSGLSMAITPGKAGELLKAYLLKNETGTAISYSAPIIIAERISDGLAILCLATTGLVFYRFGWEVLLALLLIGLTGIILIQNRPLALKALSLSERSPLLSRVTPAARAFYESSYTLMQWKPLLLAIGIGIISWTGECVALYFVYRGLGVATRPSLFIQTTFIFAFSSLVGSATGLPGGLGSADGSMLALTRIFITPSSSIGGAATLLIRLCTLWFGLLLGACAALLLRITQHETIFVGQGTDREGKQQKTDTISPMNERYVDYEAASASAHTGEKVL